MVNYKSSVTPGKYSVEFTTDSFSEYREIEGVCRWVIDRHTMPPCMPSTDIQHSVSEVSKNKNVVINGIYRHFKGSYYRVLAIPEHTETGEKLVLYTDLDVQHLWVRPLNMFLSEVDKTKYPDVTQKYRFEFCED